MAKYHNPNPVTRGLPVKKLTPSHLQKMARKKTRVVMTSGGLESDWSRTLMKVRMGTLSSLVLCWRRCGEGGGWMALPYSRPSGELSCWRLTKPRPIPISARQGMMVGIFCL